MQKNTINTNAPENLIAQLDKLHRHNRQGSYKTKARYYQAMKRFCTFIGHCFNLQKLANVSDKHIRAYVENMQDRGLSASHIKTELSAIRFWHDKVADAKHSLPENDALNLERRSFGKNDRAWTQGEYNRAIQVCWEAKHEDYAAIITLARYAGLRVHECLRIDTAIANQAVKSGMITIKGKGGKMRTVPINTSIEIELKAMLLRVPRGHKLFVGDGTPTDVAINRLQQFIYANRIKIQDPDSCRPLTFHGLRHLYATEKYKESIARGYSKNQAEKAVSKLLGHERGDVTKIYLVSLLRQN